MPEKINASAKAVPVLILTRLMFNESGYLESITHVVGKMIWEHKIGSAVFTEVLLLNCIWQVKTFGEFTSKHIVIPELDNIKIDAILFIKRCIFLGLTVIQINELLAFYRGLLYQGAADALHTPLNTLKGHLKPVSKMFCAKSYKEVLQTIMPETISVIKEPFSYF